LGTPSAPPIFEGVEHIIPEVERESSKEYSRFSESHNEVNMPEKLIGDDQLGDR
jgi:hypothetical protein